MEPTLDQPVRSPDEVEQTPIASSADGCGLPCSVVVAFGLMLPTLLASAFLLFLWKIGPVGLLYLLMGGGGVVTPR